MPSTCKSLIGLLEIPAGTITCMDSAENIFFVGTDGGRIYRYRVEPDEASCTDEDCEEEEERRYSRYLTYVELDQQLEPSAKRRIGQLLLDHTFRRLFVLCEGIVTMHDSRTLKRLSLFEEARGAHCIAINAHAHPPGTTTHAICIAVKRRIMVFNYSADDAVVPLLNDPLMMPQLAATLGWLGPTRVCAGFPKEYSLLNVLTAEATHVAELASPSPLVTQLDKDVLLRLGTMAMLVSVEGLQEGNRYLIPWESEPAAFGFKHPFIIGVEKKGLSLYSVYSREVVQRLNVPLGALFCSVCHSRTDKLFICTAKKVFLLVLASVDQLIHSLVQKVYIGHAFDLLDRHPAATPELHAERRARLHVIAGTRFLEKGKLEDAFNHFSTTDLLDCRDLFRSFFPHLLMPSAPPHEPLFRLEVSTRRMSIGVKSTVERLSSGCPTPDQPPTGISITDSFCSFDLRKAASSVASLASPLLGPLGSSFGQPPLGWHRPPDAPVPPPPPGSTPGSPICSLYDSTRAPSAVELDALAIQSLCLTPEANRRMVKYLLACKSKQRPEEQSVIDYALLWLYLKEQMHPEIDALLRHPNHCPTADCAALLEERDEYQYLAMLHMSKGQLEEAERHLQRKFDRVMLAPRVQLLQPPTSNRRLSMPPLPRPSMFWKKVDLATLQADVHPIFSATESADLAYLRSTLEEYGADVLRHTDSGGNTPLHYAVASIQSRPHMEKVVGVLVDSGADIHAANHAGVTPLQMADTREAGLLKAVAHFRAFFLGDLSAAPLPPLPPPKVKRPFLDALEALDPHRGRLL